MPDFKLAELEICIDDFIASSPQSYFQLVGIKQRLDRINETETTPQLERVLEKINSLLVRPTLFIEHSVNDDITMIAPLLDKLEMKL